MQTRRSCSAGGFWWVSIDFQVHMLPIRTCNGLDVDQASHTCSMRLKLLPSVWVTPLKVNRGSVCLNKCCQSFMFRSRPLKQAAMIRSASLEKADVSDSILVPNVNRSQRRPEHAYSESFCVHVVCGFSGSTISKTKTRVPFRIAGTNPLRIFTQYGSLRLWKIQRKK